MLNEKPQDRAEVVLVFKIRMPIGDGASKNCAQMDHPEFRLLFWQWP